MILLIFVGWTRTIVPLIALGLYGFTVENILIIPFIAVRFITKHGIALITLNVFLREKENEKHGKTRIARLPCFMLEKSVNFQFFSKFLFYL